MTYTTKDEALKLALRSLKELVPDDSDYAPALQGQRKRQEKAITAIKQALAAPVQEPDTWYTVFKAVSAAIEQCKNASGMHRSIEAVVNATQITHDWMNTDTKPAAQPALVQEPELRPDLVETMRRLDAMEGRHGR